MHSVASLNGSVVKHAKTHDVLPSDTIVKATILGDEDEEMCSVSAESGQGSQASDDEEVEGAMTSDDAIEVDAPIESTKGKALERSLRRKSGTANTVPRFFEFEGAVRTSSRLVITLC